MRQLGGTGAWSADDFTPRPHGRRRIWFQVDVPTPGASFDAEQLSAGDPHMWQVSVHDAGGWHTRTGVSVTDPDDLMATVLELLTAVRAPE